MIHQQRNGLNNRIKEKDLFIFTKDPNLRIAHIRDSIIKLKQEVVFKTDLIEELIEMWERIEAEEEISD